MPASSDWPIVGWPTVLVVGGTGLFGGHLARQLIGEGWDCVVAGRSRERLERWCAAHGGRFHVLDLADQIGVEASLRALKPLAVVDAAGPFQSYGDSYQLPRAAIAHGVHYLDIADDAEFVRGISLLDHEARAAGLAVISGASSTPALAAAAVADLARDLDVESIESAILPGNRTPRGLSVMRSILHQVGRRVRFRVGGRWADRPIWSSTKRLVLGGNGATRHRSLASLVDTPDRLLFPARFNARTVLFRAGLEFGLFHRALQLARHLGPGRLAPFASIFLNVASMFERVGSDRGGMRVDVVGRNGTGWRRRSWELVVPDGNGPRVPTQPVAVLLDRLKAGDVRPGARPCLDDVNLADLERRIARFGGVTTRGEEVLKPLFRRALGGEFERLPQAVRTFHDTFGIRRYRGRCDIHPADGPIAAMMSFIGGFPLRAHKAVDAEVKVEAGPCGEVWTRRLGGKTFRSRLFVSDRTAWERFGPLIFELNLVVDDGLTFGVERGRLGPVPLPTMLTPVSRAIETEDEDGRFRFDVAIFTRAGRRVVRYVGWLEPVPDEPVEAPREPGCRPN